MKKLLLLLTILPTFLSAQTPLGNGLYAIKLPSTASTIETRLKKAFLQDDSMAVWLGFGYNPVSTASRGLGRFANGTWTVYNTANSGLIDNQITDLQEGDSSDIIIGTKNGLSIFNRKNHHWTSLDTVNGALPINYITCLAKQGNILWVGTPAGLMKWELGTVARYTRFDWGNQSDSVTDLVVQGNDLVVGTGDGVLQLKNNTWQLYGVGLPMKEMVSDGVSIYIFSDSGFYSLSNGQLKPFPSEFSCLPRLDYENLKNNTGLASDNAGNIYFLPRVTLNPWPSVPELYLYSASGGNQPKEMRFFGLSLANTQHYLATDRVGNVWVLADKADSVYLVNPREYRKSVPPSIKIGENFQRLDINKMDAGILNLGDMFWDAFSRPALEVPKGSCKNASHATSLWIGGLDAGNNIYLAAQTYRQAGTDFFPGPLDTVTALGSSALVNPYNRIWKISRREIEMFKQEYASGNVSNGSYVPSADFREWPAHGTGNYSRNLAPFVDVNNDGHYNPMDGDYPKIKGDQMLFWIFNDNAGIHAESSGEAFGIEVHASAYAFNCNDIADGSADEVINYTTFYNYKIINRSSNSYKEVYFGNWMDVDLGNYSDDHIGSNPGGNYAYAYNGDNNDEGGMGYGNNPPVINVLWLSDTMRTFMTSYNNFSVIGNPSTSEHYYNFMRARWKDGSHLTYGGNGYQTGAPTNYFFPSNPYDTTGWNEKSAGAIPGDRRMLSTVYEDELPAGGVKSIEYAVVFTRQPSAPNGINTSWAKNTADINKVKNWYRDASFPQCDGVGASVNEEMETGRLLIYPNPGTASFEVKFPGQGSVKSSIKVMDVSGKVIYESTDNNPQVNTSTWTPGIYFITVVAGENTYNSKWIRVN